MPLSTISRIQIPLTKAYQLSLQWLQEKLMTIDYQGSCGDGYSNTANDSKMKQHCYLQGSCAMIQN